MDIGISLIFNAADLYIYKGDATEIPEEVQDKTKIWKQLFPTIRIVEVDKVLERRVAKMTKDR